MYRKFKRVTLYGVPKKIYTKLLVTTDLVQLWVTPLVVICSYKHLTKQIH